MAKSKKKKGRKLSNGGRPRKDGERHDCGKLKQKVDPNEIVVAARRSMMGDAKMDLATASDPLDFAHAKAWLTMSRYRAALTFAEAYERAQIGAPRQGRGGPLETATTVGAEDRQPVRWHRNHWDSMDRAEITAVFDSVFNVTEGRDRDEVAAENMRRWKAVQAAMTPAEQVEVFSVCIRRSWPQWIVWKAAGKEVPERWDRNRRQLESGLDAVAEALKAFAKAARRAQEAA